MAAWGMMVFDPARNVSEKVGAKEEHVEHATPAIDAHQCELVGETDGEGDVVG